MSQQQNLVQDYRTQLLQALQHLQHSFRKVQGLPADPKALDVEQLESWEAFVARFGRASDIFLVKYLKLLILQQEPGFRGSFRDWVNQAEKLGLIDDANLWFNIRELRNTSVHEYDPQKIRRIFESILREAPHLLALLKKL